MNSLLSTTNANSHVPTQKFLFKNSDAIFENELIQIGIKGETVKSSINIELYYGNKSNVSLSNCSANIYATGQLESGQLIFVSSAFVPLLLELRIHMEPMKSSIEPRVQSKQNVKIDCLKEFTDLPKLNLTFTYENRSS